LAITLETAQHVLDAGEADAVSFGKTFIANPDLPRRLQLKAALNPFDNTTFYGYGLADARVGYTDYPSLVVGSPASLSPSATTALRS
jgi:2,4-dienoyl-CoA reductase-like NADH-dependent reductase (Old Yellow Enzyme family)